MKPIEVLPKTPPHGKKPKEVLDLLDNYVLQQKRLNEASGEKEAKFFPTRAVHELIEKGAFHRDLSHDEIRSYSQTIKNIARNKYSLPIGTNKESHETEAVVIIEEVLNKLTAELKKEDKLPKDCKIYSTLFAETLSNAYKVKIHAATFRRAAIKAGFQTANESESQILISETEELKRLKEWARNKKKELFDSEIDPKTYRVFVTELKRELNLSTGKTNIKEILLREGLGIASQSEAQIKSRQTPETKKIRDSLKALKEELSKLETSPADYTIYPTKLCRELNLDEGYCTVVRYVATNEGFQTADLAESQIEAKQTQESKAIRDYCRDLKAKLSSTGHKPEDCLIYPTEVARYLQLTPEGHRPTIIKAAIDHGFQTADVSTARIRTFKVRKGDTDPANNLLPGAIINQDYIKKYGGRFDAVIEPLEKVLDLFKVENSSAYKIFALHSGFAKNTSPMSDKEIATKLNIPEEEVTNTIHNSLKWINETLKRIYKTTI